MARNHEMPETSVVSEAGEITVFCSGGTALEYVGASAMVYEAARRAGIGQSLDMKA